MEQTASDYGKKGQHTETSFNDLRALVLRASKGKKPLHQEVANLFGSPVAKVPNGTTHISYVRRRLKEAETSNGEKETPSAPPNKTPIRTSESSSSPHTESPTDRQNKVAQRRSLFARFRQGSEDLKEKKGSPNGSSQSRTKSKGDLKEVEIDEWVSKVIKVASGTEEREVCPLGVRCESNDPLHFANYQHTQTSERIPSGSSPKGLSIFSRFFSKKSTESGEDIPMSPTQIRRDDSVTKETQSSESEKLADAWARLEQLQAQQLKLLEDLEQRTKKLEEAEGITTPPQQQTAPAMKSRTSSKLMHYETKHNPLLISLRSDQEFQDLVGFAADNKGGFLVPLNTPQMETIKLTRWFLQMHIILPDPEVSQKFSTLPMHAPEGSVFSFVTLSGLKGTMSGNRVSLIKHVHDDKTNCLHQLIVLRKGECNIKGVRFPFALIAAPLSTEGCVRESNKGSVTPPVLPRNRSSFMSCSLDSLLPPSSTNSPAKRMMMGRRSEMIVRAAKPVRHASGNDMLSISDLPPDAPFEIKLNHPSAKQLKLSLDEFVAWLLKMTEAITNNEKGAPAMITPQDEVLPSALMGAFLERMGQSIVAHPLWENLNQYEITRAKDDMQSYIFSKIYPHVFKTAITKGKDEALSQRIAKLKSFVEPGHLEIESKYCNEELWERAQKELKKLNDFTLPKEKLMCILNCCHILIYMLQELKSPAGADDFVPQLIYTIIKANPDNLHSNISYISRYCEPDFLLMENLCFFTHTMLAISFIEMIQASSLNISPEVFSKYMGTG